jgi:UDP-N-acetyl-D-mannosaminuronic acid dehydrogenase
VFERGIAVLGLGYIGLPTSAAIAMQGVLVKGVDVNPATVEAISNGRVPFAEPDLDVAVAGAHARGLLVASQEVPEADVFLIAVPTPFTDTHQPDLSYVRAAAESIAPMLRGGETVILESTSPPGTTRKVSEWIAAVRPDLKLPHEVPSSPDVYVAHCPERVLPGRIMIEMIANDRVIGGLTEECTRRAARVYELFCKGEILHTDAESAEMAKLVENSFRDVNIAFANELATVSEQLGLDVWEIIRLANKHPRVNVLRPGPGVGGHCIAVDPWFIVAAAPEQSRLIRTAREVNDARPKTVTATILSASREDDQPVVCLGLAFKANVDDLRGSPAVAVVQGVAAALPDRRVMVVEPHVDELPDSFSDVPNVELVPLAEALAVAGTLAVLVDHQAFREVRLVDIASKQVVDTRGIWHQRGSWSGPGGAGS